MRNFATNNRGQIAVFALLFIVVIATIAAILTSSLLANNSFLTRSTRRSLSLQVAEAGIDKALWCLNHPAQCGGVGYTGETSAVGAGDFSVTVTQNGGTRIIESAGTVKGITRIVQVTAVNQSDTNAAFHYGVQAGVGGIELSNNSQIIGNVYANGPVTGFNGATITGDAVLALSSPTTDAVSNPPVSPLNTLTFGTTGTTYLAQSFFAGFNDRVYSIDVKIAKVNSPTTTVTAYIYSDDTNNPGTNLSGSGQVITSAPASTPAGWENGWTSQVFSPVTQLVAGSKYWLVLRVSGSSATKYWTSVRSIDDTAYANGTAKLDSDLSSMPVACGGGCDIAFRVNVGGVPPTLSIPTVGGSAYARTIDATTIGSKAYYQNIVGTVRANGGSDTCTGSSAGPWCFGAQNDQQPQDFPLTSAMIAQMEEQATAGGTTTCSPTCTIVSGSSIGPMKYVGDVVIDNGAIVTLTGTILVQGDISISNNSVLQLSEGYGATSGLIVADDPSNPATKGRIQLLNNGDLRGNSTPGTYIMALAMNADPALATPAIDVSNNLAAGIVYAANGMVRIQNNANLKEVTGQKIALLNNASITYESGLANTIFSSGPGGSWRIGNQTWTELRS